MLFASLLPEATPRGWEPKRPSFDRVILAPFCLGDVRYATDVRTQTDARRSAPRSRILLLRSLAVAPILMVRSIHFFGLIATILLAAFEAVLTQTTRPLTWRFRRLAPSRFLR